MVEALAMGIGHCLAELPDKRQALVESETRVPLSEVAVKAGSLGVVLENESRPELSLAVVEDTLDAGVLAPPPGRGIPSRGAS